MLLGNVIDKYARITPNKECLVFQGTRLSWLDVKRRVNGLANGLLKLGVVKGDRVLLLSHNSHRFLEALFALSKIGAVAVPINYRLAQNEILTIATFAEPKALIYSDEFEEVASAVRSLPGLVRHYIQIGGSTSKGIHDYETLITEGGCGNLPAEIEESDPCAIMHTSGTSGRPKGVVLTHKNFISSITAKGGYFRPEDRYLSAQPLCLAGGLATTLTALGRGCTIVTTDFSPGGVLETITREKITTGTFGPTMVAMLCEEAGAPRYNSPTLRGIISGGGLYTKQSLDKAVSVFGPIFTRAYGLTETASTGTALFNDDCHYWSKELTCVGLPLINVDLRVVNEGSEDVAPGESGEIILKSDSITQTYWKMETGKVLRDGWFYTGDIGSLDQDGYLYIIGRKKELIKTGDLTVSPEEVELAIRALPSVQDVAVIGVPDAKWGETVKALVVLKTGETATEPEIVAHCKREIASYKKPRSVEFVASLPKTATGKIARNKVKEQFLMKGEN